jgi:parallel beta-helix repeat protein
MKSWKSLLLNTALVVSFLWFLPVAFAGDIDSLQNGEVVEYFAVQGLSSTDVGGLICSNTTWSLAGSPYVVTGSSGIVIGCNATLTIEPGVVVKFDPTLAIVVGSAAFGNATLVARGTEELPITFTSNSGAPAAGDWSRIHFTNYAVDAVFDANTYISGGILEHVVVEYAGYGNYGAVFAEKSSPYLDCCEIRHNSNYGIQVDGTSTPHININDCHVWDHPQQGICIEYGSGHYLANNNIHHNREGGISFGSSGSNTLTGNTITNNTANSAGGGISFGSSGSNTLTGNTITNNTANSAGGGIYFGSSGSNTLAGNTITNNTANSLGGGIYFEYGGSNTLTGNTITNNTASYYGGGIYFGSSGSNTLTGNTITNNTASYYGGGISFDYSGSNTLTGNTITNNTANSDGGGIYFLSSGSSTLNGNNISGNTSSSEGGGIYLYDSHNTTLSGNTIANNQISGTGKTGGIFVTAESQYVSLAGDPGTVTYNVIRGNDGYQLYNDNGFNADGRNDVNARYVQWGTCDAAEIQELIFDYFDNGAKAFVMFYPFVCPGDFDMDADVDLVDLAILADNWLRNDCAIPDWCEGADLDVSTKVDLYDFAEFANNWLKGL